MEQGAGHGELEAGSVHGDDDGIQRRPASISAAHAFWCRVDNPAMQCMRCNARPCRGKPGLQLGHSGHLGHKQDRSETRTSLATTQAAPAG
ncbi:GM26834 [Drosophila sechellia]|uniref:GM26834 n=1 Tax=Drosophila sechellia TaxID=7238 RepID=B4IHW7_DROSE|nr:GM26834 [Drosophila sechellia]